MKRRFSVRKTTTLDQRFTNGIMIICVNSHQKTSAIISFSDKVVISIQYIVFLCEGETYVVDSYSRGHGYSRSGGGGA